MARNFSNIAVETELTALVDATATGMNVGSTVGWPAVPFTVIVDGDTINEEACLVTGMSSTSLTVTRGFDGTPAKAHSAGATVVHAAVADDFRKAAAAADAIVGKSSLTPGGPWSELL